MDRDSKIIHCVFGALLVVLVIIPFSCATLKDLPARPSTAIDTKRLGEVVDTATQKQDAIIEDARVLDRVVPARDEPKRIEGNAQDTKTELAKARQTIDDLVKKEAAAKEADQEKAKRIAELEAQVEQLEAKLNSASSWLYGLMIMVGALGIPVSIAVYLKVDKWAGSFGMIIAVGSLVVGYTLRDLAEWIPMIGAVSAVAGGWLLWRRHQQVEGEVHQIEDEFKEVVRSAEVMKSKIPNWDQVKGEVARHQNPATTAQRVQRVRQEDRLA